MIYVLTLQMGKEWRPVAVIEDKDTADQWADSSDGHDWVGFEMNDLSVTGLSDVKFTPKPPTSSEEKIEQTEATARTLVETNQQLIGIIERLAQKYKDKAVLDVIKGMKKASVGSQVADKFKPGTRVWYYSMPNVLGTVKKFILNKKEPLSSRVTVDWDKPDINVDDMYARRLRTGQKELFASKLLKKKP